MHIRMLPVIMVRRKTDDVVEGIVNGLLKQNMSYRKIVKTVKEMGYSISVASIHRIKHCCSVNVVNKISGDVQKCYVIS